MEIDRTDSHIPSTPTTAANLTQTQSRKGAFPSSPDLRSFRLILQLEKTIRLLGGLQHLSVRIYKGCSSLPAMGCAGPRGDRNSLARAAVPAGAGASSYSCSGG